MSTYKLPENTMSDGGLLSRGDEQLGDPTA